MILCHGEAGRLLEPIRSGVGRERKFALINREISVDRHLGPMRDTAASEKPCPVVSMSPAKLRVKASFVSTRRAPGSVLCLPAARTRNIKLSPPSRFLNPINVHLRHLPRYSQVTCGSPLRYVHPSGFLTLKVNVNIAILGHVYCHACIAEAINTTASPSSPITSCPTCREPVSTGALVFVGQYSRSLLIHPTQSPQTPSSSHRIYVPIFYLHSAVYI